MKPEVLNMFQRAMDPGPMTRSARRIRKLAIDLGVTVPEWIGIRRTRAGHKKKALGAWSWYAIDLGGHEIIIGSRSSVTALLANRSYVEVGAKTMVYPNGDVVCIDELIRDPL